MLGAGARPHRKQHEQRDRGTREQLEEPAARVLGVGEALRHEDVVAAIGERDELRCDEGQVEAAQAAEDAHSLDGASVGADLNLGDGCRALAALQSPITTQAPIAANSRCLIKAVRSNQDRKIGSAQASSSPTTSTTGTPNTNPRVIAMARLLALARD